LVVFIHDPAGDCSRVVRDLRILRVVCVSLGMSPFAWFCIKEVQSSRWGLFVESMGTRSDQGRKAACYHQYQQWQALVEHSSSQISFHAQRTPDGGAYQNHTFERRGIEMPLFFIRPFAGTTVDQAPAISAC
jgi:hypothetical protein